MQGGIFQEKRRAGGVQHHPSPFKEQQRGESLPLLQKTASKTLVDSVRIEFGLGARESI